MLYEFSLDKKAVGLLVAASAVLVLLVFILGLVIGVNWYAANPAETTTTATSTKTASQQQPILASETEAPTLPREAALEADALRPDAGAATAEAPGAAQPDSLSSPAGAAQADAPKAAASMGAEPKVIQRAKPEAAEGGGADEGLTLKREAFSVQVGVFLEETEAERLVKEMESKGYAPSVLVANDADDRPWYSVRIGAYADQAEATQAASNFTKQEKKKAVVRPIGSL